MSSSPNSQKALEYLLLNQKKRRSFLSPKKIFDFVVNKKSKFDKETIRLYKYLLCGDYNNMSNKFKIIKENFQKNEKISFDRILTLYDTQEVINQQNINDFFDSDDDNPFNTRAMNINIGGSKKFRIGSSRPLLGLSKNSSTQNNTDNKNQIDVKSVLSKDTLIFQALGSNKSASKFKFKIPNHVGKFRVQVIGVTKTGIYGINTSFIQLQKKFNARTTLPQFLRLNDRLKIPITIENNTE